MHRLLIACLLALACLFADGRAVRAEQIRFPATGDHFFIVNLLPGWTTNEDKVNGALQVLPPKEERWGMIILVLLSEPALADAPLVELARGISQSANITLSRREEPASISGRPGRAFFGTMRFPSGNVINARLVLIPLAAGIFAQAATLAGKDSTQAEQRSLDQAFKGIELSK